MKINKTAGVRLRGHLTSKGEKKPYKIKFDKKTQIPGIDGEYKSWALLANYYDKSLIRNSLAFQISRNVGLKYTPRCIFLDVIFNQNFRGCYYICDQVEVKEGRVEITEMSKDDNNYPEITGGYLLEFDSRVTTDENLYFITEKGLIGEIKYPDEEDITKEQINYIRQYLNKLEDNTYKKNFEYIDLDSFYKYFVTQEFCGDIDIVISSFNAYKERNDNKLYFGPVWDYDLAFDNDERLYPNSERHNFCFYYGDSAGSLRDFIIKILKTENIMKNINSTWFELQKGYLKLNNLKTFIEDETNYLLESANLNSLRWYGSKIGSGKADYKKNVNVVVNYIESRFDNLTYLINNYNYSRIGTKINIATFLILLLILA